MPESLLSIGLALAAAAGTFGAAAAGLVVAFRGAGGGSRRLVTAGVAVLVPTFVSVTTIVGAAGGLVSWALPCAFGTLGMLAAGTTLVWLGRTSGEVIQPLDRALLVAAALLSAIGAATAFLLAREPLPPY